MAKREPYSLFQNLTSCFIAMMALFLVLFADYERIFRVKITAFYLICGGYAVLMPLLFLGSMAAGKIRPKELWQRLCPDSLLQIAILFYLLFSLVAALLSEYSATWLGASRREGFLTIAIYTLSFYFLSKFLKPQKWMVYLFGGAIAVNGILSVLQLAGAPLLYPNGKTYYDSFKAYSGAFLGTIGNIDFMAAFFTLSIPALLLYILKAKEKARFWLLIPALLSLVALLKSWVLLGIFGVGVAFIFSIPPLFRFEKRGKLFYWAGLCLFALAGLATLYFAPVQSGLFGEIHSILHGNISEKFGSGRFYIWSEVARRIPSNLFFGTGPDTMNLAGIDPFWRMDENHNWIYALVDAAHNEYLNILFHQGIFALVAYLAAMGAVVVCFLKTASKNKGVLIFGGALIGYLTGAIFGISMPHSAGFFWLCLGVFDYYARQNKKG